jgi:cytoskeletal protein CcmA (bactofilin family)
MAIQLQVRRGTATQHNTFTGAAGELTLDTTNNSLRIHDGSTAGGHQSLKANLTNIISGSSLALGAGGYTGATLALTGNATVGGTLGVTGDTTVGGTLGVTGNTTISGSLTVTGNITLNGTTQTINSTVTTIVDPIIRIGTASGGGVLSSNDSKDRGLEFNYYSSGNKYGFIGYKQATGDIRFLLNTTNTSEVITGTLANIVASNVTGVDGTFSGTMGITGNTTVGGTLGVTGNTTLSGTLSAGATTLSSLTLTNRLGIAQGGTGQVTLPETGQILIGNSSNGFTLNRIQAGSYIEVTNTSGGITIGYTGTSGSSATFAPQATSDLGYVYDSNIIATEDLGAVGGSVPLTYDLGVLRLDGIVSISNLDQSVKSDYLGYSIIFGF